MLSPIWFSFLATIGISIMCWLTAFNESLEVNEKQVTFALSAIWPTSSVNHLLWDHVRVSTDWLHKAPPKSAVTIIQSLVEVPWAAGNPTSFTSNYGPLIVCYSVYIFIHLFVHQPNIKCQSHQSKCISIFIYSHWYRLFEGYNGDARYVRYGI